MLYSIIFVLHLMICIFLVIVVLMQASKGGGLASTFGGGAGLGTSVFGGRGAGSILTKAAVWLAVALVVTSVTLNFEWVHSSADSGKGLIEQELEGQNLPTPAAPQDNNQ